MGYLRQEAIDTFADSSQTVYAEMLTVFTDVQDQQERLSELEARMTAGSFRTGCSKNMGGCKRPFHRPAGMITRFASSRPCRAWGWAKMPGICRSIT